MADRMFLGAVGIGSETALLSAASNWPEKS
jgi:hypothetical protein